MNITQDIYYRLTKTSVNHACLLEPERNRISNFFWSRSQSGEPGQKFGQLRNLGIIGTILARAFRF